MNLLADLYISLISEKDRFITGCYTTYQFMNVSSILNLMKNCKFSAMIFTEKPIQSRTGLLAFGTGHYINRAEICPQS